MSDVDTMVDGSSHRAACRDDMVRSVWNLREGMPRGKWQVVVMEVEGGGIEARRSRRSRGTSSTLPSCQLGWAWSSRREIGIVSKSCLVEQGPVQCRCGLVAGRTAVDLVAASTSL